MRLTQTLSAPRHLRLVTAADLPVCEDSLPQALPLHRGRVHEFFAPPLTSVRQDQHFWQPPLTVMLALAAKHVESQERQKWVFVGRHIWPTFQNLIAALEIRYNETNPAESPAMAPLRHCVFLDPLTDKERFWVLDEALRCPAIAAVIGDGAGIDPTVSRRLQLAAEAGRALAILGRPWWETQTLSWAATQWLVRPQPSPATGRQDTLANHDAGIPPSHHATAPPASTRQTMCWELELLRCRGQWVDESRRFWHVQWRYQVFCGTGAFDLSAPVGCPARATPRRQTA